MRSRGAHPTLSVVLGLVLLARPAPAAPSPADADRKMTTAREPRGPRPLDG